MTVKLINWPFRDFRNFFFRKKRTLHKIICHFDFEHVLRYAWMMIYSLNLRIIFSGVFINLSSCVKWNLDIWQTWIFTLSKVFALLQSFSFYSISFPLLSNRCVDSDGSRNRSGVHTAKKIHSQIRFVKYNWSKIFQKKLHGDKKSQISVEI